MVMPTDREATVHRYVEQLLQNGAPLAIVLFGSSARGDAQPDSDLDLLVIEDSEEPAHRRGIRYRIAMRPHTIPVDVLVMTPHEVREAYRRGLPLMLSILREGRWLYGTPGSAGLDELGQ
jgi:predicted nucleotidyltransferase